MKKSILLTIVFVSSFVFMSLVVRHDVKDEAFIELAKNYPQICHLKYGEATLISEKWILTAAHTATALKDELENDEELIATIGEEEYKVIKVVIHPEYEMTRTTIDNDIALIKIEGQIDDIELPKLYSERDELGQHITIVGRGDFGTGLNGPERKDKITRAATNIIDSVDDQWITFKFDDPKSGLVTEYEGVSGPGDSGGPAFIEKDKILYIAGVSSNQRGFGQQGVYGVTEFYARVSSYLDWIQKTIE